MLRVEFYRVNPVTRCCDGSGRTSCFILKDHKINDVKASARKALKFCIPGWLDFDSNVYMIKITNLKTNKIHIVV